LTRHATRRLALRWRNSVEQDVHEPRDDHVVDAIVLHEPALVQRSTEELEK
jgi:hypothetical protein